MQQLLEAAEGGASVGSADGAGAPSLKGRLLTAIGRMQEGLVERDTEVRLLLLAALSGEHILYIGPPGTAKSELGRRLSQLCKGSYFERLLTRRGSSPAFHRHLGAGLAPTTSLHFQVFRARGALWPLVHAGP